MYEKKFWPELINIYDSSSGSPSLLGLKQLLLQAIVKSATAIFASPRKVKRDLALHKA